MATFLVALHHPNPSVKSRLYAHYPMRDVHEISSTAFLLTGDFLVRDICADIGMTGPDADILGIVFRLNGTYWGNDHQEIWDWLARATTPA